MNRPLAERELRETGKAQATTDAVRIFDAVGFVHPSRRPTSHELVRVQVPKDAIGVLTLLWQSVSTPVGLITEPIVDLPGVSLSWSLVAEDQPPKDKAGLRIFENQDPPSGRVPPYGAFSDLRHPWGSEARIKVFLSERTTLSLWVQVSAYGGEIRRVGGRLLGYTQLGQSAHAVGNMVSGW
jgi:hypothetical protein